MEYKVHGKKLIWDGGNIGMYFDLGGDLPQDYRISFARDIVQVTNDKPKNIALNNAKQMRKKAVEQLTLLDNLEVKKGMNLFEILSSRFIEGLVNTERFYAELIQVLEN